jgi:hypothetical protein
MGRLLYERLCHVDRSSVGGTTQLVAPDVANLATSTVLGRLE